MKKIIALVLAIAVIGLLALGVHFEDELFTEKREVTYLEINDEVIIDNR
jgi:hypothetical protein